MSGEACEAGEAGEGAGEGDAGAADDARAVCRCGAETHDEQTTSAPVYVTFSPEGNARLKQNKVEIM